MEHLDAPPSEEVERLQRALADWYTLERQLGRGGTSTVYLARDLRHHRQVAIKVLRPDVAASLGGERFHREIEIAAGLTHPHILPLHSSGEADGLLYYVMPYVEGETLADRLEREGQIPLGEALRITRHVAAALDYAHRRGVVHRDIKPGNILLSAGEAVVADFGIAKALTEAGDERLTRTGIAIGSPTYMSPEQASGERELDGRSDIYSLGCVLYEMLSGEPPFTGSTAAAILSRSLVEEVPPLSRRVKDVPPTVEEGLERALARDPEDRYPSAETFAAALQEAEAGIPTARLSSTARRKHARARLARGVAGMLAIAAIVGGATVAMLAIRGRDTGPTTLLSQGILEEREPLILADFEGPDTILAHAVTAAMRIDLSGSDVVALVSQDILDDALRRIGPERPDRIDVALARDMAIRDGMKGVIGGSIEPVGSGYVLTAQLVSAEDGNALVSRRETAVSEDEIIPAIDRLSKGLRESIGESLKTTRAAPPLEAVTTTSLEALYKYSESVRARGARQNVQSLNLMEEAVALDSTFAMAWRRIGNWAPTPSRRLEAITKAFELRGRLTDRERYVTAGNYYLATGDPATAIVTFETLLESHPDDALGNYNLAVAYTKIRDYAKAEEHFALAAQADSMIYPVVVGGAKYLVAEMQVGQGRIEEARATLERHGMLEGFRLIQFASSQGDYETAEAEARALYEVDPNPTSQRRLYAELFLFPLYLVRGQLAEAEQSLEALVNGLEQLGFPNVALAGIRDYPTASAIGMGLVEVWFRGDSARAMLDVETALNRFPLDSMKVLDRPYGLLASFYALVGQLDLAREMQARYEETFALDPARRADSATHEILGDVLFAEGRYTDALAEYRLADQAISYHLRELGRLGRAYEAAGQPDSALAVYERYVTLHSMNRLRLDAWWLAMSLERLGALHDERGEWEKASEYLAKFTELWKDADPELQPRVLAARQRLEEIVAERG